LKFENSTTPIAEQIRKRLFKLILFLDLVLCANNKNDLPSLTVGHTELSLIIGEIEDVLLTLK
jgi:hypothetical protein